MSLNYSIYQLKSEGDFAHLRFMHYSWLVAHGMDVEGKNYEQVYSGKIHEHDDIDELLEDLYRKFNINRPKDFNGHSVSVSDVFVIDDGEKKTAYFVDSFGFLEIPDFFETIPEKTIPVGKTEDKKAGNRSSLDDAIAVAREKARIPSVDEFTRNLCALESLAPATFMKHLVGALVDVAGYNKDDMLDLCHAVQTGILDEMGNRLSHINNRLENEDLSNAKTESLKAEQFVLESKMQQLREMFKNEQRSPDRDDGR